MAKKHQLTHRVKQENHQVQEEEIIPLANLHQNQLLLKNNNLSYINILL